MQSTLQTGCADDPGQVHSHCSWKSSRTTSSPDGTTDASERPSRLLKSLGAVPYLRLRTTEQVGDLPIHCEVFASAPAAPLLVFLPGISTYSALYAKMLYRLSQHGFNVVGIDLRGHGHSGGPRGEYTVEAV
ncbi:MAG: alpha/beta fold hydrolase [Pseudomonadota bacterium]|nr:MAG: alpha/beta fold hydrolase [Pseudomonadota bacterium]